jgi:hypothetical protein
MKGVVRGRAIGSDYSKGPNNKIGITGSGMTDRTTLLGSWKLVLIQLRMSVIGKLLIAMAWTCWDSFYSDDGDSNAIRSSGRASW